MSPGLSLRRFSLWCLTPAIVDAVTTPIVLERYTDKFCRIESLDSNEQGEGIQQSWKLQDVTQPYCYDVNAGKWCGFRCYLQMTCEYASGSGVILQEHDSPACNGRVLDTRTLATHLTWNQAVAFFGGACTEFDGKYLKFNQPVEQYPDCSAQGATDTESLGSSGSYEATYYMTHYSDPRCEYVYELSTFSTVQSNRFSFKVHRGVQHCLDYNDATERDVNLTSAVINQDINNFQFVCGNEDGLGNGVMMRLWAGAACSGLTGAAYYWRDKFDPLNKVDLHRLLNGECVTVGSESIKMDQPWSTMHYPNCDNWACSSGYCSGGPVESRGSMSTVYYGTIRTPQTNAQNLTITAYARHQEVFSTLLSLIFVMALHGI